jgi:FMN phosphatase YigB (HAD superfamily)
MNPLFFFDLDDTLVDHEAAEKEAQSATHAALTDVFDGVAFEAWLTGYRRNNLALWERYRQGEIGRDELTRRRFAEPLRRLGLDPAQGSRVSATYLSFYERSWRLLPGAEEILEHAARHGTVGILSNGLREQQLAKVRSLRLQRWVTHVVLSEDVGAMKPARAIFDAAWRSAGGGPGRRVYVGDSFETDVVGAKNAGWFPVLFDRHGRGAPAPVVYVRTLPDLKPILS